MVKYKAEQILTKDETLKVIAEHLMKDNYSSTDQMRKSVENYLENKGIIGQITEGNSMMRTTYNRRISDTDARLINECIYDMLYSRVITPGTNADNLNLPWVHVSNEDKLRSYL